MKTFINHSKICPKNVKVMRSCIDVNTDIKEVTLKEETLFEYKTTRYSHTEYLAKLSNDNQQTELALVELVNSVLS